MSKAGEWLHSEGVALKVYLQSAGRWEQLEWERVYAWMDAVVAHHAPVPVVTEQAAEHIVLETQAEPAADASPAESAPGA